MPPIDNARLVQELQTLNANLAEQLRAKTLELQEYKERYQIVSDLVSDYAYAFRIEPDGTIIGEWVTEAFTQITGYTRQELPDGASWQRLYHPDDLLVIHQHLQVILAGQADVQEYRFITKDGDIRWVRADDRPVWDETKNRVVRVYGAVQDITERRQTEQTLRTSEAALKKAQKVAHLGNWVWHIKTNQLEWSDEMYHIFGIDRENFSGELNEVIPQVIHPDDRPAVEQSNMSVIKKKRPIPLEYRVIRPDGTIRTVWAEAGELSLDSSGQPELLTGIVQDITERKQAEAALRASEERYRTVVEDQTEIINRFRPDSTVLFVNEVCCRFFGKSQEELLGRSWHSNALPEEVPTIEARLATLTPDNPVVAIENRVYDGQGQLRWMQFINRGSFDAQGRLVEIQAVGRDITERKQAEEAWRLSLAHLSLALDAAKAGAWQWDLRTNENIWSEELWKVYGLEPHSCEPSYETWRQVMHPDDRAQVEQVVQAAARQGVELNAEWRVFDQDGPERWLMSRGRPLRDNTGQVVRYIGIVMDLTDRKQAEEQVKRALQEKETLLRELYHRTKNNMMVIGAILSLRADYSQDAAVTQICLEIEEKIQAMALVHQKLYQSRDLSNVDLQEYVAELADLLLQSHQFSAGNIALRIESEKVFVLIDIAIPCGLVLNELFSNAFKYAFPNGRKGEIRLTLSRPEPGQVALTFSDNGIGVPEGFDFRAQPSLGLQTVITVVEHQLRGSVRFETGPGVTCHLRFSDSHYAVRV